jgi:zinc/manganese transport system permease protein
MFSSFMTNAWLAGTLVALAAGVTGQFVVIRGNTFAAHALPLGTFPGAAAAAFLGVDQLFGLIACAALGVIGISQLGRRQRSDVATALTLITLLGLGTLFLSLSSRYSQAVYALLFGDILAIGNGELLPVAMMSAAVILLTALFFRPLLLTSVSPDIAAAGGVSNRRMELLFLSILALATAMALPVVGALLVFSLMVGPASAARLITDRPLRAVCLSVAISLATIWSAIALSYVTNWPIGFFVGTLAAVSYGASRRFTHRKQGQGALPPGPPPRAKPLEPGPGR